MLGYALVFLSGLVIGIFVMAYYRDTFILYKAGTGVTTNLIQKKDNLSDEEVIELKFRNSPITYDRVRVIRCESTTIIDCEQDYYSYIIEYWPKNT
ncbi:MAG: hypothetical protein ACOYMB_01430 [Patescibacteria group bacterium]